MTKLAISYLFSLVLLVSIVAPTYELITQGSCELSAYVDLGEEEENKGSESVKELEVKTYYTQHFSSHIEELISLKRYSFYNLQYTSHQKKLSSPPPEQIA